MTAFGCLRKFFLWSMVPLTIFASRPTTGCTCADGRYKPVCFAQYCSRCMESQCGAEDGRCERNGGAADCCKSGQCPLRQRGEPGRKCCSPDLPTAVALAPAVTFTVDLNHHVLFDLSQSLLANAVVHASFVEHFIPFETGPPGESLVVTLRRRLI